MTDELIEAGAAALVAKWNLHGPDARRMAHDVVTATMTGVFELLAEYDKDEADHMDRFGQHHPYAGWAADHLREALSTKR